MIRHIKNSLPFLLALALLNSCADVAHDNPLDPQNKNQGLLLSGNVNTLYAPVMPIPNAVVSIQPANRNIFSSADGSFQFDALQPGKYTIYCSAPGYNMDSLTIDLATDHSVEFFLDGLPYFESIALKTHHISRFFPVDDFYLIGIETRVNDPDGIADIRQVSFNIPEFTTSDTLQASLEPGQFNMTLSVSDLPVNTIHTLIGRAFILTVMDDAGITVQSSEQYLTRVIDETPVLESPQNLETVANDTIVFNWQKVRLPYWFTHTVEIYQINFGLLTKVTEFTGISAAAEALTIENNLPNGDYVWILVIEDEFGNSSSSKEGTFNVSK